MVMNTIKFELTDGTVVVAAKDCECADHAGPHWLHADERWKASNQALLELAETGSTATQRYFAAQGVAVEESARLASERNCR